MKTTVCKFCQREIALYPAVSKVRQGKIIYTYNHSCSGYDASVEAFNQAVFREEKRAQKESTNVTADPVADTSATEEVRHGDNTQSRQGR